MTLHNKLDTPGSTDRVCKQNMSSCNSFDFSLEKWHERFSASTVFPAKNRTNWPTNKTCFALITHLLSIRATASRQMLIDNKFETQTQTGNPSGNSRCPVLASRALNMPSARWVESRCAVMQGMYPWFNCWRNHYFRSILLLPLGFCKVLLQPKYMHMVYSRPKRTSMLVSKFEKNIPFSRILDEKTPPFNRNRR